MTEKELLDGFRELQETDKNILSKIISNLTGLDVEFWRVTALNLSCDLERVCSQNKVLRDIQSELERDIEVLRTTHRKEAKE